MGELRRGRLEEGHLSRPLIYLSLQGLGRVRGGGGREIGGEGASLRLLVKGLFLQPEFVFPHLGLISLNPLITPPDFPQPNRCC